MRIVLLIPRLVFWVAVAILLGAVIGPVLLVLKLLMRVNRLLLRRQERRRSQFWYKVDGRWRTAEVSLTLALLDAGGVDGAEAVRLAKESEAVRARYPQLPDEEQGGAFAAYMRSGPVTAAVGAARDVFQLPPICPATGRGVDDVDALGTLFRFYGHEARRCPYRKPPNDN